MGTTINRVIESQLGSRKFGDFTMADVVVGVKQTRVRVSKESFLEAALSSSTYAELAEKTGQKLNTVIARYNKFREEDSSLPEMQRPKSVRKVSSKESTAEIVRRIRENAGMNS